MRQPLIAGKYPLVQPSHLRRIAQHADAVAPEALRPWPFPALTPQQQLERQRMEAAMLADELRGQPTCFGALA